MRFGGIFKAVSRFCRAGLLAALLAATDTSAMNNYKFKPLEELRYDAELAKIGKQLFFDINLTPQKLSCNDCHDLNISGNGSSASGVNTDGEPNPPTVLNSAHNGVFFSDGKSRSLVEQVRRTLLRQPGTTAQMIEEVLQKNSDYRKEFSALNLEPTYDNAVRALVEFEKALMTMGAPIDNYLRGDTLAISPKAKVGLRLFDYFGCSSCHNGSNFGGGIVVDMGTNMDPSCQLYGRGRIKVPSLRNVTKTAPYGSQGEYLELDDIVRAMIWCQTSTVPQDEQVEAIVEFLKTLEGKRPRILRIK